MMSSMPATPEPAEDPASSMGDCIVGQAVHDMFPDFDIEIDVIDPAVGDDVAALVNGVVWSVLRAEGVVSSTAGELYVRIVSDAEMTGLNHSHRGKNKPTNVLSFQAVDTGALAAAFESAATGGPPILLGDIIIAANVVIAEAGRQGKQVKHHFAHLLVHGLLHLLGYDHIEDEDAEVMEAKERVILANFGIPNPYAAEHDNG